VNATLTAMSAPERARRMRRKLRRAGKDLAKLGYPPRAYGAVRVSTDEQESSLEDQPEVIREVSAAAEPPWDLRVIFEHTGSASEFRQKENPVFLKVREVSREDRADVIVAREASRITRILLEGIELLDIWREKGMRLYLYMDEKLYDPSNHADYTALLELFKRGQDESATLQRRVSGGLDRHRTKGRLVGRTPYGYVVWYDATVRRPPLPVRAIAVSCTRPGCKWWYQGIPTDGNGVAVAECPACQGPVGDLQAALIREIIGWAADGKSLGGIALRLNKRGTPPPTRAGRYGTDDQGRPLKAVRGPDGKPTGELAPVSKYGVWTHESVLGIVTNPVYISQVCAEPPTTHSGAYGGPRDRNLGATVPAPHYPRIVDDETFWRAANRLALDGLVRYAREGRPNNYNGDVRDPGDGHEHDWEHDGEGFRCKSCKQPRQVRPGAARHDLTHIALCSVHRTPITPGNRSEVAPKDVPLNAMRDLMAACGPQLAAVAPPPRERYEHTARDSADGISAVLRAAVAAGRLAPGTRLPSSRALATKLGMSRARVDLAYRAMTADGVIVSRPQSGYFVAGADPDADGKRSYTGRYKRYYRCSSHMDVNVPEDEANEYIATVIADHLCVLWRSGGFTRRVTEERAQVRSDLKDAYEQRTLYRNQMKGCGPKDGAFLDVLKGLFRENEERIEELERRDKVASVPSCLKVFMECEGDLERTRAAYLGLDTDQRRTVLKELTREILLYPAGQRGRGHNDIADRVKVTEWSPWYVISQETATATDGGEGIRDAATGLVIYPRPQDGQDVPPE
jgi:DNA-binding transcriptional regulator YhcF (GntR family)/DNA invertase Pin-like site-specific DNA recombinase